MKICCMARSGTKPGLRHIPSTVITEHEHERATFAAIQARRADTLRMYWVLHVTGLVLRPTSDAIDRTNSARCRSIHKTPPLSAEMPAAQRPTPPIDPPKNAFPRVTLPEKSTGYTHPQHALHRALTTGIASAPENALRHQFPTFDTVASAVEAVQEVRNIPQPTQDSGSCWCDLQSGRIPFMSASAV